MAKSDIDLLDTIAALIAQRDEEVKAAEEALAAEFGKYLVSSDWGMIHQLVHKLTTIAPGALARHDAARDEEVSKLVEATTKFMLAVTPELTGPPKNVPKSSWGKEWDELEAALAPFLPPAVPEPKGKP